MAGPRRAKGFTLVELLVVITIIGMLMSLLLPAIQSAREAGRRNTCSNNMRQVALALTNLEGAKRGFPGYANLVNGKRASWVVLLLPYMERNDIYQVWQTVPGTSAAAPLSTLLPNSVNPSLTGTVLNNGNPNPWPYTSMNILICPSNPNPDNVNGPALSYVVNCGSDRTATDNSPTSSSNVKWPEDTNSGVFFNQCNSDIVSVMGTPTYNGTVQNFFALQATGTGRKTTTDFISTNDGTSNTLMVSENLQALSWALDPTVDPNLSILPFQSDFQIKQSTGFVWFTMTTNGTAFNFNNTDVFASPPMSLPFNINGVRINSWSQSAPASAVSALAYDGTTNFAGGLSLARPSSQHPTGANTIFCDGHLRFISEEIGYNVYTQLMSPRGKSVVLTPAVVGSPGTPAVTAKTLGWNYILNEADY